jgi:hypothetical protein
MRRWLRGLFAVSACALLMPTFGCRWAEMVTIEIPDFDSSAVQGVWMYRWSDAAQDYERSIELRIVDRGVGNDTEYIDYEIRDSSGNVRYTLPAEIVRDQGNPDGALIDFFVVLFDGEGTFRASTYNDAGESQLSAEQLQIQSASS